MACGTTLSFISTHPMGMCTYVHLKLCIGMFVEVIIPNREKWKISQMFINIDEHTMRL